MFGDLMGKMKDAQIQIEETKKKLEVLFVEAEVQDGLIKATANGNKRITNIEIDESLLKDKEGLEDLVLSVINRVLEKAEDLNEKELQGVAKGILPKIPGLF